MGSEVIGLIPERCLLEAAEYYIKKDNLFILSKEHKIRLAVDRLGLHSIKYFNPKEKIIEWVYLEMFTVLYPFIMLENELLGHGCT